MKKKYVALAILAGVSLARCTTTSLEQDIDRIMQRQANSQITSKPDATQEKEINIEQIATPENRYHWSSEEHLQRSLRWYNPSLRTLEAGLESKDLGVIIFRNGNPILADEARVKLYPETRSATIEYKIDDIWYETIPGNPGNIDLNKGEEGGIYIVNENYRIWPDDPVDGFFFR